VLKNSFKKQLYFVVLKRKNIFLKTNFCFKTSSHH